MEISCYYYYLLLLLLLQRRRPLHLPLSLILTSESLNKDSERQVDKPDTDEDNTDETDDILQSKISFVIENGTREKND